MAFSVQSNTTNQAAVAYQSVQTRPQEGNGQVSRPDLKPTAAPNRTDSITNGTPTVPTGNSITKAIGNETKPAATLELSEVGRNLSDSRRFEVQAAARQAQTATKVAVESKQSSGRASQNGFSQIGQTLDASA